MHWTWWQLGARSESVHRANVAGAMDMKNVRSVANKVGFMKKYSLRLAAF
jgi:hypothetical protein